MVGKRKSYLVMAVVLLFSLSFGAAGCGSDKPAATTTQGTSGGQAKVVNVGWSGPLSGGAAIYGQDTVEGLKMAVEEINGKGGITVSGQKYTINLITLDDQYMPNMTATNARRLRSENKVPVIFTPHAGGVYALQEFNLEEKFLIVAHSADPQIAERGNKLTFVAAPPFSGQPEPFSRVAMEKYGKKVALIPATHKYAKDWTTTFVSAWEKLGGQVTGNFAVDYNKETDFYTYVSKALATKPDVLFVGGPSKPTAMIIKQARQLGFKGGFVLMDQARLEEMEKVVPLSDLTGCIGMMPLYQMPGPGVGKFVENYKARYGGKLPTFHHAGNYMAMKIVARGMEKAGTVEDAAKIFEGMKQIFPIKEEGFPYELTGINSNGSLQVEEAGVMVTDGKYGPPVPISVKK
ncbi:MAG: ABC transporter substrate-binding protein [Bacillota bacterium]